jgi:hypothetical protein
MFLAAAMVLLPAAVVEASAVRVRDFTGLDDVRHGDGATYDLMAERMFEGTMEHWDFPAQFILVKTDMTMRLSNLHGLRSFKPCFLTK